MRPSAPSVRRHIGLDSPAFQGRLRQYPADSLSSRHVVRVARSRTTARQVASDGLVLIPAPHRQPQGVPKLQTPSIVKHSLEVLQPQPYAHPAQPRQQRSQVLHREQLHKVRSTQEIPRVTPGPSKRRRPKLQVTLVSMAVFVFGLGVFVSLQTVQTNHQATAQVSALAAKQSTNAASSTAPTVPSTVKPTPSSVAAYTVAPSLPRYIDIPSLNVHARILPLGILSNGALGAPSNVFDSGWYTKSALPGQPGAMLMDGHVSSWDTNGVFYGLKNLKEGDTIQITRGDNTKFTYQVVTKQTFDDNDVDMQAALSPITSGKNGLNLITCTGKVKPGTSEFAQRIVIYTEQI